jgi:hypothetical protein
MALHQPEQVYRWLEADGIARHCAFETRDGPAYTIAIETPDTAVQVETSGEEQPVCVRGEAAVDPELLVSFGDDTRRQTVLGQLSSVVAGSDGEVTFRDAAGERCALRDVRRVTFEKRVYPGAVTRHRLLTAVRGIASDVRYLETVLANFQRFDAPSR